jgi:hypothetical protein
LMKQSFSIAICSSWGAELPAESVLKTSDTCSVQGEVSKRVCGGMLLEGVGGPPGWCFCC